MSEKDSAGQHWLALKMKLESRDPRNAGSSQKPVNARKQILPWRQTKRWAPGPASLQTFWTQLAFAECLTLRNARCQLLSYSRFLLILRKQVMLQQREQPEPGGRGRRIERGSSNLQGLCFPSRAPLTRAACLCFPDATQTERPQQPRRLPQTCASWKDPGALPIQVSLGPQMSPCF